MEAANNAIPRGIVSQNRDFFERLEDSSTIDKKVDSQIQNMDFSKTPNSESIQNQVSIGASDLALSREIFQNFWPRRRLQLDVNR